MSLLERITTTERLDELPVGATLVHDSSGSPWAFKRRRDGWYTPRGAKVTDTHFMLPIYLDDGTTTDSTQDDLRDLLVELAEQLDALKPKHTWNEPTERSGGKWEGLDQASEKLRLAAAHLPPRGGERLDNPVQTVLDAVRAGAV